MNRQKGVSLIELILSLSILSVVTMLGLSVSVSDIEARKASQVGEQLYQLNKGIAAWSTANYSSAPATKTDTNWLKSTTCTGGTSTISYIPCSFSSGNISDPISHGNLTITSSISIVGVSPNKNLRILTTTSPYKIANGKVRSDLAGIAAIAAASSINSKNPLSTSARQSFTADPLTGSITMSVEINSENEAWLRTDGVNDMEDPIFFLSSSSALSRQINGISRIENIVAPITPLYLGNSGGDISGYTVTLEGNKTNLGTTTVSNNKLDAVGISILKGNLNVSAGNITTSGNLESSTSISAGGFYDKDNAIKTLDPSGTSDTTNQNTTGYISSKRIVDLSTPTYFLDPNLSSNINTISSFTTNIISNLKITDDYVVGERIGLTGGYTKGTACTTEDSFQANIQGALVICKNGKWTQPITSSTRIIHHNVSGATAINGTRTVNLGNSPMCELTGVSSSGGAPFGSCRVSVNPATQIWTLTETLSHTTNKGHWCSAICYNF